MTRPEYVREVVELNQSRRIDQFLRAQKSAVSKQPTHSRYYGWQSQTRGRIVEHEVTKSAAKSVFPPLPRLGPIGFLRSLLTLGCLWLPLIFLRSSSQLGVKVWMARIGYLILALVWLIQILRRLEDAGYPLLGRAFTLTVGLLMTRALRPLSWGPSRGSFDPNNGLMRFMPTLPPWINLINGYEMLSLFLLIQTPLALLPSKPRQHEPPPRRKNKYGKQLVEWRKTHEPFLVDRFAFLRRLLVIATLWLPLIYVDSVSDGRIGTWIARLGYFVLTFAWLMNSDGRLKDAGRGPADHWQYCLVISVAALMPLAVHWVNGYEALAIFVLIQIPIVFPKSKRGVPDSAPSDPLQVNQ